MKSFVDFLGMYRAYLKDKLLFCIFSKCTSLNLRKTKRLPKTIANIAITIGTDS